MSDKRLFASCISCYAKPGLVFSARILQFQVIFASDHSESACERHLDWKAYLKTVIKLVKRK